MRSLQIEKSLVVSTIHIPEDLAERLRNGEQADLPTYYAKDEYGWQFHAVQIDDEPFRGPPELVALLEVAAANDCTWLVLDADGPEIEGLPQYEWAV